MPADRFLFILDVERIQDYIFSTNRLKTIIGASSLLDRVASESDGETFRILKEPTYGFVSSPSDDPSKHPDFILSAGGVTKLLFTDKIRAEEVSNLLTEAYRENGILLTTHIEPFQTGENEYQVHKRAEATLAQKKYNRTTAINQPAAPYLKICELCGRNYAERFIQAAADKKPFLVCRVCAKKFEQARDQHRLFDKHKFVTDLSQMESGSENKMLALVVMDGNNMGDKISRLDGAGGGFFGKLKDFSIRTEEVFTNAFQQCIQTIVKPQLGQVIRSFRPILMAGDDLCFIMDASIAFEFVQSFVEGVENASRSQPDLFQDEGIALSAGILVMKSNHPFNFGHRIAESLLRSAKAASRKKGNCSMLDFHVLISSTGEEIQQARAREYTYEDPTREKLSLTQRPYDLEDFKTIRDDANALLKRCLARNKTKYLRQVMRMGRHGSMVEILKIASRLDETSKKKFIEIVNRHAWNYTPEGLWQTGILDVVETADLL